MQDIGDLYNYVPPEVFPLLVKRLGVPERLVYSMATFYKTISMEPRDKYIVHVCTGTTCHVRGADKIMDAIKDKLRIDEGGTTEDLMYKPGRRTLHRLLRLRTGVTVNKEIHGGLDRASAMKVIQSYE